MKKTSIYLSTNILNNFLHALFTLDRAAPLKLTVAVFRRLNFSREIALTTAQILTGVNQVIADHFCRVKKVISVLGDRLANTTARAHRVQFGIALTKIGRFFYKNQIILEPHFLRSVCFSHWRLFIYFAQNTPSGPTRHNAAQLLHTTSHLLALEPCGHVVTLHELVTNHSELGHNLPANFNATRARHAVALANLSHVS